MRNCGLNVVRSANQSGEFNAKYEFVPSIPLLELHSKDDRVYSLGLGLEAFALYFTLPDILRTLSCKSILIRCRHASERVMRTDCCDKWEFSITEMGCLSLVHVSFPSRRQPKILSLLPLPYQHLNLSSCLQIPNLANESFYPCPDLVSYLDAGRVTHGTAILSKTVQNTSTSQWGPLFSTSSPDGQSI